MKLRNLVSLVKAVSIVDEGPVLMKSLRTFSIGMINGQVIEKNILRFKKCPLSIRVNRGEGRMFCKLQISCEGTKETNTLGDW